MQQTDNYKLNLIETSDTFSPNPLNDNMEKVEAAMDGLDQRIAAIEIHQLKVGTYSAQDNLIVNVGFRPKFVIIHATNNTSFSGLLAPTEFSQPGFITDTGFQLRYSGDNIAINRTNYSYIYIAFA